jgi:hypothetical protein
MTPGEERALGTPGRVNIEVSAMQCETPAFQPAENGEIPMETLPESNVIITAKSGGVDYLRAIQIEGGFALFVKMKCFKEERPIHTTRKREQKVWVSLDRLAKHIEANYGDRPPLLIVDIRRITHETHEPSGAQSP